MLFASLAILLAGASSVRAHGYPQTVNIGGQTYQAWHPFADPYASPNPTTVVRKVADDGPITFDSADLTCNKGGNTGNGVTATVAAGQDVTWTMNTWPRDHYGPVTVYMADCGESCDSFSGSGDVWFKVSGEGLIDASKFYWASDKLIDAGNSWTSTIPSNIKAGNYLMRLELLALHSSGAPQLYPSCTQLKVTGGGNGAPTSSEMVSIPGVYSAGDPGLFGNIWNQPTSWPTVGPAVAAFVSGAAAPAPAPATSTTAPATSTPAPATSTTAEPTEEPETSAAATSTPVYEPETTPSPTKSSPASTRTIKPASTANAHKTCRVKSKQQQRMVKKSVKHSAKREYMRRVFGKMRL